MRYYVIGDEDTVLGFGMVGVRGTVVRDRASAEEAFRQAIAERDIGILIITEKIADHIYNKTGQFMIDGWKIRTPTTKTSNDPT